MRDKRIGYPVSVPDGPVNPIDGYLDYYPFSKGIAQWVDKFNFYNTQKARQQLAHRDQQWSLDRAFLRGALKRSAAIKSSSITGCPDGR
jgi:hypothetical protein